MPSVRIKRPKSSYSVLTDNSNVPQSLATVFTPNTQPTDNLRQGFATDGMSSAGTSPLISNYVPVELSQLGTDPLRTPVQTRPRSGSRILSHVMSQRDSRFFRPSTPEGDHGSRSSSPPSRPTSSPLRLSVHNRLEGSQADVGARFDKPTVISRTTSAPHSIGSRRSIMEMLEDEHHHDDIVDHLDCVDPQVATMSTLTNAANSIIFPPLSFYSRKPIVYLSPDDDVQGDVEAGKSPFEDSMDRHVDDVLKRPSKFRRTMQGVWSFLKTPMGIITGIYGFLVVFWGAAIVLFLAKIINLHNANTQGFWVEVSSQIENGLFTVTGIGLIPSRVLDTYRVYKIWHYKRKTKRLRAKAGLPPLIDTDDLPDPVYDPNYVHVLSDKEQKDLHRQQVKFQHHQTWYRAHGTETHRAFPIKALLICCFNDGNSIFQIMLCGTMWGLNRFQRPAWSTGCLIPASFLCGILSAVFIWKGGQKTKRSAKVEEELRVALGLNSDYTITVVPPETEGHTRISTNLSNSKPVQ